MKVNKKKLKTYHWQICIKEKGKIRYLYVLSREEMARRCLITEIRKPRMLDYYKKFKIIKPLKSTLYEIKMSSLLDGKLMFNSFGKNYTEIYIDEAIVNENK